MFLLLISSRISGHKEARETVVREKGYRPIMLGYKNSPSDISDVSAFWSQGPPVYSQNPGISVAAVIPLFAIIFMGF